MAQPRLRHSEKFRTYQRQAIEMVRRYRNNYSDLPNVERPTSGAALVCHPTGTGKTVVTAGLAHAAPEIGNVLVLTTREAVRDQLSRELAGDLFIDASKFGLGINIRLAKVVYVVEEGRALLGEVGDLHGSSCKPYGADLRAFSKRQFDRLVDRPKQRFLDELATGRSIVLMTVQMLVSLERETHAAFAAFCKHIDLVLFDEGHYEPAVKYSAAVRSLNRPVVLMSATPFRNDLKPFQVHKQNIHILKFADAVDGGYIREVEVVQKCCRDPDIVGRPQLQLGVGVEHLRHLVVRVDLFNHNFVALKGVDERIERFVARRHPALVCRGGGVGRKASGSSSAASIIAPKIQSIT